MITKGDKTKAAIQKTTKELLMEKGYANLTMKDICDKQGLSRGGLYRYYSSTKEIFVDILDTHKEKALSGLEDAISRGVSARQLAEYFIETQKNEILSGAGQLSMAIYEFCKLEPDQKHYLEQRFAAAVSVLEKMLEYGQQQKEFAIYPAGERAAHLILFLEGLRLSSSVLSFEESLIANQLEVVRGLILGY